MRRITRWFFPVMAVVSLAGLIRLIVVSAPGDPQARTQMLTAALFVVLAGTVSVLSLRADRRALALDRSGPVRAARDSHEPASGSAAPWSLETIGAQLARELAPMNGVVFREGRSRRLRIMLDPASAIVLQRSDAVAPGSSPGSVRARSAESARAMRGSLRGQWWEVTWRKGRAPGLRERTSWMGARLDADGRALPRWRRGPEAMRAAERFADRAALEEAQRVPAELVISSEELARVVDEIAVRSGWASS